MTASAPGGEAEIPSPGASRQARPGPRAAFVAVAVTAAATLAVATTVKRPPPDFATPPVATLHDGAGHALWTVRLAPAAHEIAVDALAAARPPANHAYQLWLQTAHSVASLGLLPPTGRAVIPEVPALVGDLAGKGELVVSLEPAGGSPGLQPSGAILFRAALAGLACADCATSRDATK